MGKYIFNRIIQVLPVIAGVLIISFVLMVVLPGDPVLSMVGERYDENTVAIMKKKLNLDKPLIVRMGIFVGDVADAQRQDLIVDPGQDASWVVQVNSVGLTR